MQTLSSPKCIFSGIIPIDLKRFQNSGIALVKCPDCARTRSPEPEARRRVPRHPPYGTWETSTRHTKQRRITKKTIWETIGGERT